jgi:hypothetical protein
VNGCNRCGCESGAPLSDALYCLVGRIFGTPPQNELVTHNRVDGVAQSADFMWDVREHLVPELLNLSHECCGRPGVVEGSNIITEVGNKFAIPILQGAFGEVTVTVCLPARFDRTSGARVRVNRNEILETSMSMWVSCEGDMPLSL